MRKLTHRQPTLTDRDRTRPTWYAGLRRCVARFPLLCRGTRANTVRRISNRKRHSLSNRRTPARSHAPGHHRHLGQPQARVGNITQGSASATSKRNTTTRAISFRPCCTPKQPGTPPLISPPPGRLSMGRFDRVGTNPRPFLVALFSSSPAICSRVGSAHRAGVPAGTHDKRLLPRTKKLDSVNVRRLCSTVTVYASPPNFSTTRCAGPVIRQRARKTPFSTSSRLRRRDHRRDVQAVRRSTAISCMRLPTSSSPCHGIWVAQKARRHILGGTAVFNEWSRTGS